MPKICEFFGIVIHMYFDDHNPAHFHAIYGEYEALICIDDLVIIKGKLPSRAYGLVVEWASEHKKELKQNWRKVSNLETPSKIKPLK